MLILLCRQQVGTWRTTQISFDMRMQSSRIASPFFIAQDFHQKGQLGEAARYYRDRRTGSAKRAVRPSAESAGTDQSFTPRGTLAAAKLSPLTSEYHHRLGLMLVQMRDVDAGVGSFNPVRVARVTRRGDLGAR